MANRNAPSSYLPALTGIRAVAAMMVFVHHMAQIRHTESFFRDGYVGVTVFFTLSGYLITRTYLERFAEGSIRFSEYWFRRAARIVPVYLLILLTKLALNHHAIGHPGEVLAPLTLTQGFFGQFRFSGLSPGWSLTIEESFYLLAPALFWILAAAGRRKPARGRLSRAKRRTPAGALLVLVAACILFRKIGTIFPHLDLPWYFLYRQDQTDLYSLFGRLPEFAIGVWLAVVELAPARPRAGLRISRKPSLAAEAAFVLGVATVIASTAWLRHLAEAANTDWGIWSPSAIYCFWIAAAGTAAVIWSAGARSVLCARALGNPVMEYLGRASYVLYLLQDRFITDRIEAAVNRATPFHISNGCVTYVACNLVAIALYEGFERPVHEWLLDRWRRRVPRARTRRLGVSPS